MYGLRVERGRIAVWLALCGCSPGEVADAAAGVHAEAAVVQVARPAVATAPTALSLPEFLGRGNVCRRAVGRRLPKCLKEWDANCDRELLAVAYSPTGAPTSTGNCYYHDRVGCPKCACDFYVKVHRQGYDGGTGCLGTPEDLLRVLYAECAAQRCEPR